MSFSAWADDAELRELRKLVHDLKAQNRYPEAAEAAKRLIALTRERVGENSVEHAAALEWLSSVYWREVRINDAVALDRTALAIRERVQGEAHPDTLEAMSNLAATLGGMRLLDESIALYERALALQEKTYGPDDARLGHVLMNLGLAYADRPDDPDGFAKGEAMFRRLLAIQLRTHRPDDREVLRTLDELAGVYHRNERDEDAEQLYRQVIDSAQKRGHTLYGAGAMMSLAQMYSLRGQHVEALEIYERAVVMQERYTRGRRNSTAEVAYAESLSNLGSKYFDVGRYQEAAAIQERSLALKKKFLSADSVDVAHPMHNLASAYFMLGRRDEARQLFEQVVSINEKAYGETGVHVGQALFMLAVVLRDSGDLAAAATAAARTRKIYEKATGANHSNTGQAIALQASIARAAKRYAEAGALYREALEVLDGKIAPENPISASARAELASAECASGDYARALSTSREAAAVFSARLNSGKGDSSPGQLQFYGAEAFPSVVCAAYGLSRKEPKRLEELASEALLAASQESRTSAAAALSQMALRASAGDPKLAASVRKQQDLVSKWQSLDTQLSNALSQSELGQAAKIERLRRQRADAEQRVVAATAEIEKSFPEFTALTNPKPIGIDEVRTHLKDNEALIAILVLNDYSYVWAVTKDKLGWERVSLGRDALAARVDSLRKTIDLSRFKPGDPMFDAAVAHDLYKSVLGPVESVIRDKSHLLVVPSGPLTGIPFQVFVTQQPSQAITDPAAYRDVAFLLNRHALTTLPSVASLKALRSIVSVAAGSKPLTGYGDPIFSRETGSGTRGRKSDQRESVIAEAAPRPTGSVTRSYGSFYRGPETDLEALSKGLPQLPETATELKAIASKLGVPDSEIHLGKDATEVAVKKAKLDDYRVVYFATHGLVAGDVKGLGEPALALTLPKKATDADDGLLTASEVASLKLNADWVVLSACNTAAGDTPGAEALSGLARAFFYSGARALLVSHWPVGSQAAERLTTSTMDVLQNDPAVGRSEALRRAMLAMISDTSSPWNAYPGLWAPFVVVGEGNR